MGLDYLMKKVWHPGSMKNIEKVWEAEEKQREIDRKYLEMKKKLHEERHNEQLKKLQVEAGLIPRSHLDRMDWMYDWGNRVQNQERNAEEYLTGKPVDANSSKNGREVKQIFKEQITNAKCEDFALTHEDPMYAIMLEEKKARQAIQDNPLRMREIYDSIEGYQKPRGLSERKRSSSKEKSRKHKKDKKDKKRKRSRSPESVDSTSRSSSRERHRRNRSRSRSRDKPSRRTEERPMQSELYKEYMKERFGPILTKDQEGNLRPDFSKFKKKHKTEIQLSEEQRREQLRQMMENGRNMYESRMNRVEPEADNGATGDTFMDIRRKQIEENDLQRNLARSSKRRHHDDE